jgi:hypothetical protein
MAALTSAGHLALHERGDVGDRAGGGRHAQRAAVEDAFEVREHLADGLGGAGRGRDDVRRGAAGAAQVLVRAVEQHLVVGVAVDGGHHRLLDAEGLVEHLHDRGERVRRAAGVRDDDVLRGVVRAR